MTDSFDTQAEAVPAAANTISDLEIHVIPDFSSDERDAVETSLEAVVAQPNGFVKLGLAKELLQAVADMGFTQPTAVQQATIPKAMQALDVDPKAPKFTDLLVSSQTGSGKTAAFLLPVLHTLLKQQADAEHFERSEFERLSAEAIARGEAPLKKPKRKDPTNMRNFCAQPANLPSRYALMQSIWFAIAVVCALPTWWAAFPTNCKSPSCKTPTLLWPRQADCLTCSAVCKSSSTRFSFWWWMKPTAC